MGIVTGKPGNKETAPSCKCKPVDCLDWSAREPALDPMGDLRGEGPVVLRERRFFSAADVCAGETDACS